jgi:hypothetical protein
MQRRAPSGAHRFRPNKKVLAVTAASALVAAGVTAAVVAQSSQAGPTALTATLAAHLSQNVNQRVIVILADQPPQAHVGSEAASVRADAISSAQQPLLSELAQVHATHIKRYTLVNALAATVSAAEESRLRANPDVEEVIPDVMLNFAGSEPATATKTTSHKQGSGSATLNVVPGACSSTPQLTPEGLALTGAASSDPSQPTAASLGITGAGVKVAFIADGIDPDNINFIRADGKTAFADYQDFSGAGGGTATAGGEAFLDANTIAGQGLHVYNLNGFGAESYPTACNVKIQGVAPGASLVGLDVFAENTDTTESNFLQAIDYAVEQDHVNVLNESFGSNNFPDVQALDVGDQFDNAAVAAGVVVSVSTGDSGPFNTIGSPASDPNVISSGASTQLQGYAQGNFDGTRYFAPNGWVSDNISALSSSGFDQTGGGIDLVAPGDTSWASCQPDPNYGDCYNDNGNLSDIEEAGGTSEAAPWVSGTSALVIQAYAKTHGGADPSPALVKQIILSTATDLGEPATEQGAGLVNDYKAVELAESINTSSPVGSTLLLSKSQLNATGAPGSAHTWPVTITNTGSSSQTVTLTGRGLGPEENVQSGSVNFTDSGPQVTNDAGLPEDYNIVHFTVAPGQDRLSAEIAYPGNPLFCLTLECTAGYQTRVEMSLITPDGKLAANTSEQGPGNFGSADVRYPQAGTWTGLIIGDAASVGGTNGTVDWRVATQRFDTSGWASPSQLTLAPGQSQTVTVGASSPSSPGDAARSIVVSSAGGATSIEVDTRSLIEPSGGSYGGGSGSFSGTMTGGNGRNPGEGEQQYYEFDVPSGISDITANLSLSDDPGDPVGVYLVSPDGDVVGYGQNSFNQADTLTATAYTTRPVAGTWTLIVDFAEPVQGDEISQAFTGNVAFNAVSVSASGLPDGKSTVLTPGKAVTVPVTITNTGSAPEDFFIDARTNTYQSMNLASLSSAENIVPLTGEGPLWLVPTQTSSLQIDQQSVALQGLPSQATMFDAEPVPGDPDLAADGFSGTGEGYFCGVDTSVSYSPSGGTVTPGLWEAFPSECGPYLTTAPYTVTNDTMTVVAKGFDQNITSPTGDLWPLAVIGSGSFSPAALNPGQTVTIPVTITPEFVHNTTTFEGNLYIDTIDSDVPPYGQESGDEATALPYEYTVDGTTVG